MIADRPADPRSTESPADSDPAAAVEAADARTLRAGDVMSVELMTVDVDEGLLLTWELVSQAGVHHIPVMEKGSCLGVLTERDLALNIAHNPLGHPRRLVRELIDGEAASVDISTPVPDVAGTLLATGQDAVLVHSATEPLVGMVTSRDLLRALAGQVPQPKIVREWDHARTLFRLTPVIPIESNPAPS